MATLVIHISDADPRRGSTGYIPPTPNSPKSIWIQRFYNFFFFVLYFKKTLTIQLSIHRVNGVHIWLLAKRYFLSMECISILWCTHQALFCHRKIFQMSWFRIAWKPIHCRRFSFEVDLRNRPTNIDNRYSYVHMKILKSLKKTKNIPYKCLCHLRTSLHKTYCRALCRNDISDYQAQNS